MDTSTEASGLPEPTELEPVANLDEGNDPSQATAAEGEGVQPQEQADQPKKTFTQEEVDSLIQKRLTKEARRQERAMAQRLADLQSQFGQGGRPATPTQPQPGEEPSDKHPQFTAEQVIEEAKKLAPQFAQQAQEQARHQQALEKFWERADEVAERFPDFDSVVRDPSFAEMRGAVYEFCMASEVGPEVAYHLAKNRAQARSIARMSTMDAARSLMTLESELKAKPKAQPSKAPDPINPVGSRGAASRSSMPSDEDDVDTWVRKERERMKKAGLIR